MSEVAAYEPLEEAFEGGCAVPFGFELAQGPRRTAWQWRRAATTVMAFAVILVLHASLLLLWRTLKTPALDAVGPGSGAGGIQLSLVSGRLGAAFAQFTAESDDEPDSEKGAPLESPADSGAPSERSGDDGADATANAEGHSVGGAGAGDTAASSASVGGGYDPGAFASLAPMSFSRNAEPGFWEQVRRCFKDAPLRQVTLNVVLDEKGEFIDAYTGDGTLVVAAPSLEETQTVARALDALRGCSPYHDIRGGLARRLILVVPAENGMASPGGGVGG